MLIKIDPKDGLPLYLQIAREVKHSIAVGSLRAGEQLPSVREIATQITVNPNTVAKAYRELELRGIVETRRGSGTYVSKETFSISEEEKRHMLGQLIDKVLDEGRHLRVGSDELIRLFRERMEAFEQEIERQEARVD